MQFVTNLNFQGQCKEAFTFYAQALGADLGEISYYKQMPADPEHPLEEKYLDQVMHVTVHKDGTTLLMGADMLPMMGGEIQQGNNVEICIIAENKSDADLMFAALSDGGTITMPMEDQFWGDYFGSCTDTYGVGWMIMYSGQK